MASAALQAAGRVAGHALELLIWPPRTRKGLPSMMRAKRPSFFSRWGMSLDWAGAIGVWSKVRTSAAKTSFFMGPSILRLLHNGILLDRRGDDGGRVPHSRISQQK